MSENENLNEHDANEVVNKIESGVVTVTNPATGARETVSADLPEPNDLALTLANHDYPVLGKQVYELARKQRQQNMEQAVIDFVTREMHTYAALQVERERCDKAMNRIERRLTAIQAGEFTLDSRTAAITFKDKEL